MSVYRTYNIQFNCSVCDLIVVFLFSTLVDSQISAVIENNTAYAFEVGLIHIKYYV